MRPDDNRPSSDLSIPSRQTATPLNYRRVQSQAAAEVVRSQIDAIYSNDPNYSHSPEEPSKSSETPAKEAPVEPNAAHGDPSDPNAIKPGPGAVNMQVANQAATAASPYERTLSQGQYQTNAKEWDKYHSAWQSYYQQYYERYYVGHVYEAKKSLEASADVKHSEPETISTDEAMYDLRSQLRNQITTRARKVRKSRHFIPIIAGLCVMLIFMFLQYNRVVFASVNAYVTPSNLDPSTLIIDPNAATVVSSDPRLIIPKIGVDVPIVLDAVASDEKSLNSAMDKGVAWFNIRGADAQPGQLGNFVLSGHSSNDWLDQGEYKFIFARLEQMSEGDAVYVNFEGVRYTYSVRKTQVVKPTDVSALFTGNDKPELTLITCTPLGTALNRLLVFADQISPDPSKATQHTNTDTANKATKMPANSPTFLERIFGGGN